MIRLIIMLSVLSVVFCQYAPRHRGPPPREEPIPVDYEDEPAPYRPVPRMVGPPPRSAVVHKPASVHYVNIGAELAGDYKFGYDTGKGNDGQSFREETRLPDGTVKGAYGYVDASGQQRIVKYTAGKDGFKVEGDGASEAVSRAASSRPEPQPAPRRPETVYEAPPPPPQPAYRPAPPPQPAYRPAPQPQPAYRPPAPAPQAYRPAPAPQQSYRPAPAPQQSYRPPPQASRPAAVEYAPPPQPAYRAPPQPAYRASPPPQRPRARPQRPAPREQYAPRNEEPDYDYPENDITERRLVPIDTALFNYNIGTGNEKSQFLSK